MDQAMSIENVKPMKNFINESTQMPQGVCDSCQSVYQVIYFDTGFCNDCNDKRIKEYDKKQEIQRMEEINQYRYNSFKRVCPKDMFETDTNRIAFPLKLLDKILSISPHEGGGLYLFGETGSFKSRICWMWVKKYALKGFRNGYSVFTPGELYRKWLKTFQDQSTEDFLNKLVSCDLIFIDDLGAEKISEGYSNFLFALIDYMKSENKYLLITSNYSPVDLKKRFKDRDDPEGMEQRAKAVFRRLIEYCKIIEV